MTHPVDTALDLIDSTPYLLSAGRLPYELGEMLRTTGSILRLTEDGAHPMIVAGNLALLARQAEASTPARDRDSARARARQTYHGHHYTSTQEFALMTAADLGQLAWAIVDARDHPDYETRAETHRRISRFPRDVFERCVQALAQHMERVGAQP